MIKFDLVSPVLLLKQLDGNMANAIGMEEQQLIDLWRGGKENVLTEDEGAFKKYDFVSGAEGVKMDHSLTGSEAILWLCKEKGYDVQPVTEIFIPWEVYRECTDTQWLDICCFAARVEARSSRAKRLEELNAPKLILVNEKRIIQEQVQMLESNNLFGHIERRKDQTIRRALNDIGYSLSCGWEPEMLEEFERRIEEGGKEMEEQRNG